MKLENPIAVRSDKAVYRDGDMAVKVFNENYAKADVLNEALNTARVEQTGILMPHLEGVSKIDGKWAISTRYIAGKSLQQLMEEHPERMDEYLNLFVDIQMNIHKHTCPMLNHLTEKMQKKISASALDATARYELHTRLASMKVHNKLCHGDFVPSNVIISASGAPYVLDWSHATQGNASADVARTYLVFCLEGKQDLADKYLKLFCKKSDTAIQYVQRWIPIVAASQSVKGKPEEKELLLQWADVVEYQ